PRSPACHQDSTQATADPRRPWRAYPECCEPPPARCSSLWSCCLLLGGLIGGPTLFKEVAKIGRRDLVVPPLRSGQCRQRNRLDESTQLAWNHKSPVGAVIVEGEADEEVSEPLLLLQRESPAGTSQARRLHIHRVGAHQEIDLGLKLHVVLVVGIRD